MREEGIRCSILAMTTATSTDVVPAVRRGVAPLVVLFAGTLALAIAVRFLQEGVWDDGYMFVRYADNLLHEGRLAWNPGGPGTYGLTGLAFLAVVVPVRLLLPGNALMAATLSSLLCGFVFLASLVPLVRRRLAGHRLRGLYALWIVFGLAIGARVLCVYFTNGMDTSLGMAFLAFVLLLWDRKSAPWLLGLAGGLAFWIRPDLLAFTLTIPAAVALLDRSQRRAALLALGITIAVVAVQMALSRHFLHSALPLAFYAKSGQLYRDLWFEQVSAAHELGQFVVAYLFLFAPLAIWLATGWRRHANALQKAILASLVLFVGYHVLVVTPILGEHARFFHPALPAVIYLAIDAIAALVDPVADRLRALVQALEWPARTLAIVLLLLPLLQQDARLAFELRQWTLTENHTGLSLEQTFPHLGAFIWYRFDRFARLPDDLVVATTEVGEPAVMAPHKTIIDMAGINDTEFALAPLTADRLLAQKPDLIYLPPPAYRGMLRQLRESAAFQRDYVLYEGDRIKPALLGVAIRRSSRHFGAMQRIISED